MKKFYCYSKCLFDIAMEKMGYMKSQDVPSNIAIISIGAPWNEHESHWFDYTTDNVLNIDFDDVSPETWWEKDYYDEAMEDLTNQDYYFTHIIRNKKKPNIHTINYFESRGISRDVTLKALDYNQARDIVRFIEKHKDCDFYIHCSAGVSRSQGVVRYVLDTYGPNEFVTNPDNPCICPNVHVTRMLKRAYRQLIDSEFTDESCE